MKPTRQTNIVTIARWTARGLLGGAVLLLGSAACSSGLEDCDPPVPPGARYKVTVLGETEASAKCHIATLQPTFEITAATEHPGSGRSSCKLTPAEWAPQQQGLQVVSCTPDQAQMLGTNCEMKYPSTCPGLVNFYFYQPGGVTVNWAAPRIENVLFRIQDTVTGCIPNIANCLDEYRVVLERLPD